jgi:hypothetical protein
MNDAVQPIFVFSLPRSGSTLLQRLLGAHPAISSRSEPWFLLSYLMPLRPGLSAAVFDTALLEEAVEDLVAELPGKRQAYLEVVKRAALDVYRRLSSEQHRYFVDKTPRYHLISELLLETFPEAKFIFLWRNPLAIAASIIDTWGEGRWNLGQFRVDFDLGLPKLIDLFRDHEDRSLSLRYEDLVDDHMKAMSDVFGYLKLETPADLLERADAIPLSGRMGDRRASSKLGQIEPGLLRDWTGSFRGPMRKRWARHVLDKIGDERIRQLGYDAVALRRDLEAIPGDLSTLPTDTFWEITGHLDAWLNLALLGAERGNDAGF